MTDRLDEIKHRRAFAVYGEPGTTTYEDITWLVNAYELLTEALVVVRDSTFSTKWVQHYAGDILRAAAVGVVQGDPQ